MIDINKILTTQSNTLDIVLHAYSATMRKTLEFRRLYLQFVTIIMKMNAD